MPRTGHILNAASNLLGITLLIIAGLNIASKAEKTLADEVAWAGAVCFALSCLLSYLSIRTERDSAKLENWADRVFLGGMGALFAAVAVLAFY